MCATFAEGSERSAGEAENGSGSSPKDVKTCS
jgi:hypothetical protein